MSTSESWFADNRANWDGRAAVHEASGYGIDELVSDPARRGGDRVRRGERVRRP
ncbi:hypothetical protein [Brachybacterium sp.]|uniref:hypothetical protein n=1 Tax=Brachybacterium sp. TaxID=1891286 RepID=UPI002ED13C29